MIEITKKQIKEISKICDKYSKNNLKFCFTDETEVKDESLKLQFIFNKTGTFHSTLGIPMVTQHDDAYIVTKNEIRILNKKQFRRVWVNTFLNEVKDYLNS
jgi:hypothetical protein